MVEEYEGVVEPGLKGLFCCQALHFHLTLNLADSQLNAHPGFTEKAVK